jgi:hypothetical protein
MLEPEKITYYMHTLDQRGEFLGLTNQGNWQEINLVKTQADQMRGNHFLNAGEGIKITPYILHRFHYLENSVHIQLLDTPFNSENQDLHTLISDKV